MTSKPYTPVSCAQHSEYELAIMRQQTLVITWQDEYDETHQLKLEPYDVITEHKAEYLLAKDYHSEDKKIRLDKIIEAYPG
jgi:transcriptional antiterminator Rof (Rho-off)